MTEVLINSLDACNPLYFLTNGHSTSTVVIFKLIGIENYKMWYTSMKLALKSKNNIVLLMVLVLNLLLVLFLVNNGKGVMQLC